MGTRNAHVEHVAGALNQLLGRRRPGLFGPNALAWDQSNRKKITMGLTLVFAVLLVDLFFGIIIGRITTRTSCRCCRQDRSEDTAAMETEQGGQCERLLIDVEEQLIRHEGDLKTFLAAADPNSGGRIAVNTPDQFARLKLSNDVTGEVLDDALARWPQFVQRFRAVFAADVQSLTGYRRKIADLSRTADAVASSANPEDLVHTLHGAIRSLQYENKGLREQLVLCQQELRDQTTRREVAERDARIDSLTGLPNRRAFDERIAQLQAQYERHHNEYTLVLIDLDRFKLLNDRRGHAAGDAVLAMVARVLRDCCGTPDHVSRYGGEEFALLIPGCTTGRAASLAERCRFRIEMARLLFAGYDLQVTASVGVAQVRDSETTAHLLVRADAALYTAKQAGRNTVRFDDQSLKPRELLEDVLQPQIPLGREQPLYQQTACSE